MPIVDIKGVGQAQFPDDMSKDQIRDFLRTKSFESAMAQPTLASMARPQTIEPVEPTMTQNIGQGISDYLFDKGIITDRYRAQEIGRNLSAIGEFLPGIGDATAGDEFGRAVREGDKAGMGLAALGAIPVVGDVAKGAGKAVKNIIEDVSMSAKYKTTLGQEVESMSDIDFDFPITHSGGKIEEVEPSGVFEGLFGSPGMHSSAGLSHENLQTTFYPRKGKVMDEGDADIDFDDAMEWIKEEFPDSDEDKASELYDIIMEDKDIFDMESNPLSEYGFDDLGEASWEGQRLRGKYAGDKGFDAVAMDDETGTSYLIPFGSGAIMER